MLAGQLRSVIFAPALIWSRMAGPPRRFSHSVIASRFPSQTPLSHLPAAHSSASQLQGGLFHHGYCGSAATIIENVEPIAGALSGTLILVSQPAAQSRARDSATTTHCRFETIISFSPPVSISGESLTHRFPTRPGSPPLEVDAHPAEVDDHVELAEE